MMEATGFRVLPVTPTSVLPPQQGEEEYGSRTILCRNDGKDYIAPGWTALSGRQECIRCYDKVDWIPDHGNRPCPE
jgi:hypothetical protein